MRGHFGDCHDLFWIDLQGVVEVKYIRERGEQERILRANHIDVTAGHMGVKKTLNRINERFMWHGLVKDVEDMVNSQ